VDDTRLEFSITNTTQDRIVIGHPRFKPAIVTLRDIILCKEFAVADSRLNGDTLRRALEAAGYQNDLL